MKNKRKDVSTTAEAKMVAREELIYNLTEDLIVVLEDKKITKAELARMLGRTRGFVTQLLDGSRNMTIGTLSDICTVLGVKPTVRVLPNGAKVLQYENEVESKSTQEETIKQPAQKKALLYAVRSKGTIQEVSGGNKFTSGVKTKYVPYAA